MNGFEHKPMLRSSRDFDPQRLRRADIRVLEERSLAELSGDVVQRDETYQREAQAQARAESDPNRLSGDERACFKAIVEYPETIERRCERLGWDRDGELRARAGLQKRGLIRVAGTIGNRRKIYEPTAKGRRWAEEEQRKGKGNVRRNGKVNGDGRGGKSGSGRGGDRDRSDERVSGQGSGRDNDRDCGGGNATAKSTSDGGVKGSKEAGDNRENEDWKSGKYKSGSPHEAALREVQRSMAETIEGIAFHDKGYADVLDGIQADTVARLSGGQLWAIQVCDGNRASYEVRRLCQLANLRAVDLVLSVSVTRATREKLERELGRQVETVWPEKLILLDVEPCFKPGYDWSWIMERPC